MIFKSIKENIVQFYEDWKKTTIIYTLVLLLFFSLLCIVYYHFDGIKVIIIGTFLFSFTLYKHFDFIIQYQYNKIKKLVSEIDIQPNEIVISLYDIAFFSGIMDGSNQIRLKIKKFEFSESNKMRVTKKYTGRIYSFTSEDGEDYFTAENFFDDFESLKSEIEKLTKSGSLIY
jgi:hypothetical protein